MSIPPSDSSGSRRDPWGNPVDPPSGAGAGGYSAPGYPPAGAASGDPFFRPPVGGQGAGTPGMVPQVETCTWHPDRQTALHCTRCGRPACPDCLTPASVGFQCRACVAEGRSTQRAPRTVSGAPHGQQPKVTIGLIVINIAVFVITAVQAGGTDSLGQSSWFNGGVLVPAAVADGDWWRLLTSGFLHLSITHIGLNMLSLYFVGLPLERVMGRWRFLSIYVLSLLGGSVAVMVFAGPTSGAVGASGAIFGLMGALVPVWLRFHYDLRPLMIVVVINLAITFVVAGISWQAHIGGLVVGGIAGAAMVYPPAKTRLAWQVGICVGLLVLMAVVLVVRTSQIAM